MSKFGTVCKMHDDHPQTFGLEDLDDKGIYRCDTCHNPITILVNGRFHRVEPLPIINYVVEKVTT